MKNKKTLIIIGIVILVLFAGIFISKSKDNNKIIEKTTSEPKSIFSSVKDALTQNLTLSCEFTNETGTSVKSYIKNGAVRVTSIGADTKTDLPAQAGEIIMKDKKMYIWDTATKEGFVYPIEDQTEDTTVTSESYLNMIDKYKDSCKVASLADSFFVPPTDINFKDMSKILEDMKKYGNP